MPKTIPDLTAVFALNLAKLRRLKGWSQGELAVKLDMTPGYISLLEAGERSPSISVLASIAAELGTTASKMIEAK